MQRIYKQIELVTNVIVILLALMLGGILLKRFVLNKEPAIRPPVVASVLGKKIQLPNIDWSRSERHLVLVLQKDCRFCTESAPFYQKIITTLNQRLDVQLIAALPQPVSESKDYLYGLGVAVSEIRQADPSSLGATGTPTLLLVDRSGTVRDVWVGKLPPAKEQEVFSQVLPTL